MKLKKNSAGKLLSFLAFLMFCGAIGFFLGKMGLGSTKSTVKPLVPVILLLIIPSFLIVIAIHEAGHAMAGVWMKFDFRMFVVGPFMWDKEQKGWRFKWNKNVNTAGGFVICLPTSTENLRKRFAFYAAGGPVLSLLLTAVSLGLFLLLRASDQTFSMVDKVLAAFFILLSVLSAMIFIVTAIPMQAGGFSSDGARVFRLLKGGDRGKLELVVLKVVANSSAGIRPKFYDTDELNEGLTIAKKLNAPFGVYIHGLLHSAEFDRGNIMKAEEHLLDYIAESDKIPEGLRSGVWLYAAFFYAFAKGDPEKAEYFWGMFKPSAIIPNAQVYATLAAIAYCRKDIELMHLNIDKALAETSNMMDKGAAVMTVDKMMELKQMY
jgi:hypothetical protein